MRRIKIKGGGVTKYFKRAQEGIKELEERIPKIEKALLVEADIVKLKEDALQINETIKNILLPLSQKINLPTIIDFNAVKKSILMNNDLESLRKIALMLLETLKKQIEPLKKAMVEARYGNQR